MAELPPTAAPRSVSQEQSDIFGRLADVVRDMDAAARAEGRPLDVLPPDTQAIREANELVDSWQR
jgi:hypothetical protein